MQDFATFCCLRKLKISKCGVFVLMFWFYMWGRGIEFFHVLKSIEFIECIESIEFFHVCHLTFSW